MLGVNAHPDIAVPDRFLTYDELVNWLHKVAAAAPNLVELSTYGTSYEGRDLVVVTITDSSTGAHNIKPAHWVDANIHALEVTASVAACHIIEQLVTGWGDDPAITRALQTRTFYIVPRVNPDGVEWVLADRPRFRRSSVRPWPWTDGHRWSGAESADIDGDGRILQMRIADPHGAWMPHPDDERVMVPIPPEGATRGTPTYRLLSEGPVGPYDGFTIGDNKPPEGLDMNRNFPAGWGTSVPGSGDHPLSEPEIDALVRAISERPNICGYHAFHTFGGVLLRPSSTRPDTELPPFDVWAWKQLGAKGTELTTYPVHSVFEDFTWDRSDTMSGAADDWLYEHKGVISWTTEFWDLVYAATGKRQGIHQWYLGPTDAELLAAAKWCDDHHPEGYVDWYRFDHPELGEVELGGWNELTSWFNPPAHLLADEVRPHASVVVHQALCSPRIEILNTTVTRLAGELWQVEVGVANTGWLPTDVSAWARKHKLVLPLTVEVSGAEVTDGPARRRFGQLEGRSALRFRGGVDATPDRVLASFVVTAVEGTEVTITAHHPRAGTVVRSIELA